MQAALLFSQAVSTDFTVAAGKRGHVCLRCSLSLEESKEEDGGITKIEQETRRVPLSKKYDEEE